MRGELHNQFGGIPAAGAATEIEMDFLQQSSVCVPDGLRAIVS